MALFKLGNREEQFISDLSTHLSRPVETGKMYDCSRNFDSTICKAYFSIFQHCNLLDNKIGSFGNWRTCQGQPSIQCTIYQRLMCPIVCFKKKKIQIQSKKVCKRNKVCTLYIHSRQHQNIAPFFHHFLYKIFIFIKIIEVKLWWKLSK